MRCVCGGSCWRCLSVAYLLLACCVHVACLLITCCLPVACLSCAPQELESRVTPLNAEYWGCLLTLADHELEAQRCVSLQPFTQHYHCRSILSHQLEAQREPRAAARRPPQSVHFFWGSVRGLAGLGVCGGSKGWQGVAWWGRTAHPLDGMNAVSPLQELGVHRLTL